MQQMMFQRSKFKIQSPSGISQIIAFIIALVILMTSFVRIIQNEYGNLNLIYITGAQILFYSIILIHVIYRKLKKPSDLVIHPESLFINGRTVEANQIKIVMVMGYFKPVLGIKPTNKKNVPTHLCFRFLEDEDKGMKELKSWAELNQIPFVHKRFARWV